MLTRLSLLISFLSASAASIYGAAMVTCSQPGFSETVYNGSCSVGAGVNNTFSYEAYTRTSLSGDRYIVEALSEVRSTPVSNAGSYPISASATWDDIFALPNSNPTDIFKLTVTGGGLYHPSSIQAGPISYTESDFCDAHYIGNAVCTKRATVSAASLASVELMGSDSFIIDGPCGGFGCNASPNSDLYERITIQRFLADGITADPFLSVPEPSTIALLLLAVPIGLAFRTQR
jgi:hypothetical protein